MTDCPREDCLNGCGGVRSDCPMREWVSPTEGKRGGQTTYTPEVGAAICARMAAGEPLRQVCRDKGMPPASTVRSWVVLNIDGFAERYAHARDGLLEHWAEEIVQISDDGSNDYSEGREGAVLVNHDHINRSRLRVDTRKWLLSKLKPKTYGDKVDLNHSGEIAVRDMTDEQLVAAIAAANREILALAGSPSPAGSEGGADTAPSPPKAVDLLPGPGTAAT